MEQQFVIYVSKKEEFAVEAKQLLLDLREVLELVSIAELKIYNCYEISGPSGVDLPALARSLLAEAPLDESTLTPPDLSAYSFVLPLEALPGQYDQRADWTEQSLTILSLANSISCSCSKLFAFKGDLSESEKQRLKAWLLNPLESRTYSFPRPLLNREELGTGGQSEEVESIAEFALLTEPALAKLQAELHLSMSLADLQLAQRYFREEGRNPRLGELKLLDTYWSDHCRHTTFNAVITDLVVPSCAPDSVNEIINLSLQRFSTDKLELERPEQAKAKALSLMTLATQAARVLQSRGLVNDLDISAEINACSIKRSANYAEGAVEMLLMFKNETHNHPSEIEPFGGAATCLGGAIRDPLSGRAYVYQALRLTGAADPTKALSATLPGKLPQRKITQTALRGFSSYGNQIGLATGKVHELYHPGYEAKRFECGAVIAAVPAENVRREEPVAGDLVLLLGGRTGRDGIGGATGSSKAHDEQSLTVGGAEVQKGNALTERKLQRFFRKPEVTRLIKRCNDFGAGGVAVAVGELAAGLEIELEQVPLKYQGLKPYEIALSESQERMALVIAPASLPQIMAAAGQENLECSVVATVSAKERLTMKWRGQTQIDLARSLLDSNGAPRYVRCNLRLAAEQSLRDYFTASPGLGFAASCRQQLNSLAHASQRGLQERFDSSIGAGTCLMPFGGRLGLSPEQGMAALIPCLGKSAGSTASLMSFALYPDLVEISPFHGAYLTVLSALLKLAALGKDPCDARLSFQEYFRKQDSPDTYGEVFSTLLGAYSAQMDYGVPAIGGKDSMSGTYAELHVPPTFVAFAVTTIEAAQISSACLPEEECFLYYIRPHEFEYMLPKVAAVRQMLDSYFKFKQKGKVRAAFCGLPEGLAPAVIQACFGNRKGFVFTSSEPEELFRSAIDCLVFASSIKLTEEQSVELGANYLGYTQATALFQGGGESLAWEEALQLWEQPLSKIFPVAKPTPETALVASQGSQPAVTTKTKLAQSSVQFASPRVAPKVLIPVFPGSNCEYDLQAAFHKAGANCHELVFRNRSIAEIETSLKAISLELAQSDILCLPGGFSAADEPEGSAKFICAVFNNPLVKEALLHFLERNTLTLGICNGFQALIKMGLLPHGQLRAQTENSPTLSYNSSGQHIARYVCTEIRQNTSPWLCLMQKGERHIIPISHGEGRFIAQPHQIAELEAAEQIASVYCCAREGDEAIIASNPNGSCASIEGILSPNGRIFGKMGHSERCGTYVALNIPGNKEQNLFSSAVHWLQNS